jgi:hypothetical protein
VFVLKGDRLGELAIVDPKSLVETKKALKMAWCGGGEAAAESPPAAKSSSRAKKAEKADEAEKAPAPGSRGPVKKGGDPQDGGE